MKTTQIDGFKVTLDNMTQCWIEKGKCCSSLALMETIGQIEDPNGDATLDVPEATRDKIREWADANGL